MPFRVRQAAKSQYIKIIHKFCWYHETLDYLAFL